MIKENIETSELNHHPRNQDSVNNFVQYSLNKDEAMKEQEMEMSKWRSSSKLKGAIGYFIGGLYLLIAGIVFSVKNNDITELRTDYYLLSNCQTIGTQCCFPVSVPNNMPGPIYLYVEIKNYNQNTMTYFKKFDASQLYNNISGEDEGDCNPFQTNAQVNPNVSTLLSINNTPLSPNANAFPCGVRAYDHFTDTFTVTDSSGKGYTVDRKGYSWQYDIDHMKNTNPSLQWIDLEDETIQVWMRPAGLSKFRKNVGKINSDLPYGNYNICSSNVYDYNNFDSTKSLILSNVNSVGGKNLTLVVSHLVGGSVSILGSIGLLLWHFKKRLPK